MRNTPARGANDSTPACDTNHAKDSIPAFGGTTENDRSVFSVSIANNCLENSIDSYLNHDITLMNKENNTLA